MPGRSLAPALTAAALLLAPAATATAATSTSRPVIGIYSAPFHGTAAGCSDGCDYVAASYVKFLEAAGAESLPIPYDSTDAEVEALFPQLNGVLFPGGGSSLPEGAKHLFQLAKAANDNGTHVPVWGTCLGFEWLLEIVAAKNGILDGGFDSENISMALNLTAAAPASRMLGPLQSVAGHRDRPVAAAVALRADLSNAVNPPAMNNHQAGLTPADFAGNANLAGFFDVLSTNLDRKGKPFVSTIEGKAYPVYGTQWHPEKNNFEWGMSADGTPYESINHSPEAVFASQSLANFFVGEARRNGHARDATDPKAKLFWDYAVSQATAPEFEQCYLIPTGKGTSKTEVLVRE